MILDTIVCADALAYLAGLPDNSVHCAITSTPYYKQRDYGIDGQLGQEETPAEFVQGLVTVFNEVRRVLRPDGVFWLNIADSYSSGGNGSMRHHRQKVGKKTAAAQGLPVKKAPPGFRDKNLLLIPARLAIALQDSGWNVRAELPWIKANAMPESVEDRPVKAHEVVFMLTKTDSYHFDLEAMRKPLSKNTDVPYRNQLRKNKQYDSKEPHKRNFPKQANVEGRSYRSTDLLLDMVFEQAVDLQVLADELIAIATTRGAAVVDDQIAAFVTVTEPTSHKHTAPFPTALIKPAILASCPVDGIVLDPFMGSGTTALVARNLKRHYIGCDLNPQYVAIALDRLRQPFEERKIQGDPIDDLPLFKGNDHV